MLGVATVLLASSNSLGRNPAGRGNDSEVEVRRRSANVFNHARALCDWKLSSASEKSFLKSSRDYD